MNNAPLPLNERKEAWTPTHVLFWRPPSPFSQWTGTAFELDGHGYGCSEQYMMAEKARLFGDEKTLAKILATPDPRAQRSLGREVSPFDASLWDNKRFEVVTRGNHAKFSQCEERREYLLSTGDRMLVEASPRDRIWGIGLDPEDPRALDQAQWRGKNLLGRALMEVRAALQEEVN